MKAAGSLEFTLGRLGARVAARPTEFDWRRIEIVRGAAALLDAARAMPPFTPWLAGMTPDLDVHAIEARFRARWKSVVAEVGAWMPERWQPAIAWCATIGELPALAHLARGGRPSAWMAADEGMAALVAHPGSASLREALQHSPLAPLAPAVAELANLHAAWAAQWRQRVPPLGDEDAGAMAALARVLARHRDAFAATSGSDGWALRRTLAAALELRFHRSVASPAAVFAYLALVALDAERLRGEVVRRVAFPRMPLAA